MTNMLNLHASDKALAVKMTKGLKEAEMSGNFKIKFARFLKRSSLSLCALLVVTACSVFDGRSTVDSYMDDAAITTQIKADILKEPTLPVTQINVETLNGEVQLSGFIDSVQTEAKVVQIANGVKGVKSVHDNLIIRHRD